MISTLKPLIKQFMPFAQKRMGFNKPARVLFKDDPENASNPLGKTAYYDPESMSITLYTTNRHPKDIMRSLSHELVHHTQNCNGEFDHVGEMGEGYAQNDKHLREMERQAYEQGNLCFRDWEDSIKGTIYNESLHKGAKNKMSIKDWKNNELSTLLTEKWGFSFNLLTESQEEEVVEEAAEEEVVEEATEEETVTEEQEEEVVTEEQEGLEEGDKPDFLDLDKDGDKEESMKDAAEDKKEKMTEAKVRQLIRQLIKEASKRKQ